MQHSMCICISSVYVYIYVHIRLSICVYVYLVHILLCLCAEEQLIFNKFYVLFPCWEGYKKFPILVFLPSE